MSPSWNFNRTDPYSQFSPRMISIPPHEVIYSVLQHPADWRADTDIAGPFERRDDIKLPDEISAFFLEAKKVSRGTLEY